MGASKINKKTLRMLAMDFNLDGETWHKKSSDRTLLRCLDDVEAKSGEEIYWEICFVSMIHQKKIITNNAQNFNWQEELCAK